MDVEEKCSREVIASKFTKVNFIKSIGEGPIVVCYKQSERGEGGRKRGREKDGWKERRRKLPYTT